MPTPSPMFSACAPSARSYCASRSSAARLRRQSYDLNEEGLFNVEYADVLGIPFDFTAKPVIAPPQPPRETIQVKAVRPERDALEIRFPACPGYRVELPEERLKARIQRRLRAGADARSGRRRPITRKSGIIGEGVELNLVHTGRCAPSTVLYRPHYAPALHQMARPRRRPQAPSVRPAQAHHPSNGSNGYLVCKGGTYPGAADVPRCWPTWPANASPPPSPAASLASGPSRRCLTPTTPPAPPSMSISTPPRRTAGRPTPAAATSIGSFSTATGRRILPRGGVAPARAGLCQEPQPRSGSALPLRLGDAQYTARTSLCWWMTATATTTCCT